MYHPQWHLIKHYSVKCLRVMALPSEFMNTLEKALCLTINIRDTCNGQDVLFKSTHCITLYVFLV